MHKVLVIDDHVDVAPMIAAVIIALGHEARYAMTAQDALAIAQDFQPDLAFIDIAMPNINGFECARLLRERFGDEIRLIAMSGYPQYSWPKQPHLFEQYLIKPMLSATIREIVGDTT